MGSRLLKTLEAEAMRQGIACLFVEASIMAKDFFIAKGFTILNEQTVSLRGEHFINYALSKKVTL